MTNQSDIENKDEVICNLQVGLEIEYLNNDWGFKKGNIVRVVSILEPFKIELSDGNELTFRELYLLIKNGTFKIINND